MRQIFGVSCKLVAYGVLTLLLLARTGTAHAETDTILYAFGGGSDGSQPRAGLIADGADNLYGTTSTGAGTGCGGDGCGTVFKLASEGVETVLHAFTGGSDGALPQSGLIADKNGNLFGTATEGGAGYGTVFEIAPDGTETVLYAFTDRNGDGRYPAAKLLASGGGDFFGTTSEGGLKCDAEKQFGCGTVFDLAPDGTETVLYTFKGDRSDGAVPAAEVISDNAGNLYGTTEYRGSGPCKLDRPSCGTVFKIAPGGTETVLHAFVRRTGDGAFLVAGLIADVAGNLYGTTEDGGGGGGGKVCGNAGCGTVFRLAPDGSESLLHVFTGSPKDGAYPLAGLIADKAGNLYGTTRGGGEHGFGTVFKIAPDGTEKALHAFAGGSDGATPVAGLIAEAGYLYGTTLAGGGTGCFGGVGCGTVFKVKR